MEMVLKMTGGTETPNTAVKVLFPVEPASIIGFFFGSISSSSSQPIKSQFSLYGSARMIVSDSIVYIPGLDELFVPPSKL
jgi:hypothetical protein